MVLTELLDQVLSLSSAVAAYPNMKRHLAESHQAFTTEGDNQVLAGSFLILEESLKYGKSTRQLLREMKANAVDFSQLEEVEYLLLLTIINTLFTAEALAKDIGALQGSRQMEAARSIYDNENDPRGESVRVVLRSASLADRVKLHRALRSRDYVSFVLEGQIRPQIPDEIAGPGVSAFRRMQSTPSTSKVSEVPYAPITQGRG